MVNFGLARVVIFRLSLPLGPIEGIQSIDKLSDWIEFGGNNNIPAIVLNSGVIDKLSVFSNPKIIIQSMGLPDKCKNKINKIPFSSIEKAIQVGASAVSVQINFQSENLQEGIQNISTIIYNCNKFHIPVLFMVNQIDWESSSEFEYAVRVCIELGADIVKITLPSDFKVCKKINPFPSQHPPVVLAGGTLSENIRDNLSLAKKLGFSGVCIGRNIFQNEKPINIFSNSRTGLKRRNSVMY